ncbi:MAG: hypothetical protein R2845_02320 [Thermomicrobiales bacterium]
MIWRGSAPMSDAPETLLRERIEASDVVITQRRRLMRRPTVKALLELADALSSD